MRAEFRRDEGGAALVEAALVLPVVLVLVLGLAELALYFWQANAAVRAVGLGLRRAVVSDSVAAGPGLTPALSTGYWDGREPGARCAAAGGPAGACPSFTVRCRFGQGCACTGFPCGFVPSERALGPIMAAMRAAMPELKAENVEITYATNGLGYVGRPIPVPVDVTVRLVDLGYPLTLLGLLPGPTLPLRASATLPGEDLRTN